MDRIQSSFGGMTSFQAPGALEISSGILVLYLLYRIGLIVYNLWFHPLAKFPGPLSRAGSTVFEQLSKLAGNQLIDESDLHEKYGPIVRVSPDTLSFINPQAWKDIYTHKANKRQLKKDPKFYGIDGFGGNNAENDGAHAMEKKFLLRGFSDTSLREQEPLYSRYFDLFVEGLGKQIDGPKKGIVDMHEWFSFIAVDIIGDLVFGVPFGSLETAETHDFIRNIYQSIRFAAIQQMAMRYRWLAYLIKLTYWMAPSLTLARKRHHDFTTDRIDKRLASTTDRKDFISHIWKPKGERGLSREEIIRTCDTVVTAGSDTITTLLSGCLYFLMKNPVAYTKLQAEVRGYFRSASEMNMHSTARLPYLQAVLDESLRCYPPAPNRGPRVTGPEGDLIDGHFIPPKTVVAVANYVASNSELNFHKPNEFVPERWLEGKDCPAEFANDKLAASQAFSYGPRSCLGRNLAWVEMRSILARFIWHFECEMLPETDGWKEKQKTFIIWDKPPLMMKISRRKDLA